MKYNAIVRRPDGTEFESGIDTNSGNKTAVELARNLAESYGFKLVGLKSIDGEEIPVGDDQNKDTEERVDEQDKTTSERVEDQKVETKEVSPDKTGDVKPNR